MKSKYQIYSPSPYFYKNANIGLPELTPVVVVVIVEFSSINEVSSTVDIVLTSFRSKSKWKN